MFALLVEAWAGEPGSWADFPTIRAPPLIICGENGEPDAAPPRLSGGEQQRVDNAARHARYPRQFARAVRAACGAFAGLGRGA